MNNRILDIGSAQIKLEEFKKDPQYVSSLYAIEENIAFLEAIKSLPRYIAWLFGRAQKIDGTRLLELTDFPVEEWDIKMHSRLIGIQKQDRPGLIKPLVDAVVLFIQDQVKKEAKKDIVLADLGAGGAELDLQIAKRVLQMNVQQKIVILAIDKSLTTRKIALENLAEIKDKVELVEAGEVNMMQLDEIKRASKKNVIIVLCTNNIFELEKVFPKKYFDVVYHSLFKHHLGAVDSKRLDSVLVEIAKTIFEYDGFKNMLIVPLQTLVGWKYPNFLNAEIFSNLRFQTKKHTRALYSGKGKLSFYAGLGNYLFINTP
jgi:hypothetical protein